MHSLRFMMSSRSTLIGDPWSGIIVSFHRKLIHAGGDELIPYSKGSLGSRTARWAARTTPEATRWCKHPPSMTYQ